MNALQLETHFLIKFLGISIGWGSEGSKVVGSAQPNSERSHPWPTKTHGKITIIIKMVSPRRCVETFHILFHTRSFK